VQGFMKNTSKKRALTPKYSSEKQFVLEGFETPFHKNLDPENQWMVLGKFNSMG
jgi:IS5 family transposase